MRGTVAVVVEEEVRGVSPGFSCSEDGIPVCLLVLADIM